MITTRKFPNPSRCLLGKSSPSMGVGIATRHTIIGHEGIPEGIGLFAGPHLSSHLRQAVLCLSPSLWVAWIDEQRVLPRPRTVFLRIQNRRRPLGAATSCDVGKIGDPAHQQDAQRASIPPAMDMSTPPFSSVIVSEARRNWAARFHSSPAATRRPLCTPRNRTTARFSNREQNRSDDLPNPPETDTEAQTDCFTNLILANPTRTHNRRPSSPLSILVTARGPRICLCFWFQVALI